MAEDQKSEETISCKGCRLTFLSKNKLFTHLRQVGSACLPSDEYAALQADERNWQRIAVLYGYIPGNDYLRDDSITDPKGIAGGDHAAWVITQAIDRISRGSSHIDKENWACRDEESKVVRSYGSVARGGRGATLQDPHTGAITEVLCTNALVNCARENEKQWTDSVNDVLDKILAASMSASSTPGRLRVFGRVTISKRFSAESDLDRRRVDYVMPVDMFFTENERETLQGFCDSFNSFGPGTSAHTQETGIQPPDATTLDYLLRLKRLMMKFTSQADFVHADDSVIEKESNDLSSSTKNEKKKTKRQPRRKRFHNFSNVLAHEFMAYRRVDRMFHRATIRLAEEKGNAETSVVSRRPFIVLSCSGDFFLRHQVARMIGLLIAICRGLIDEDIIEALFDEEYSSIMLAPAAPHRGLLAGEAGYTPFEGKAKAILSARRCGVYDRGFNDDSIVSAVERWEVCEALGSVARSWLLEGVTENGEPISVQTWLKETLEPWAAEMTPQLEQYRQWKSSRRRKPGSCPQLPIESFVPLLYREVLGHLRSIDADGLWPTTTPSRQLVMLSTVADTKRVTSLAVAHTLARKNDKKSSLSPYSYEEGEGGASGSFRYVPFSLHVQVMISTRIAALASCQAIGPSQSTIRPFLR